MNDRWRFGRRCRMATVAGALMASALLAGVPNAQEQDPILLPLTRLRDAVRPEIRNGDRNGDIVVCLDEQRRVRVPCASDGLQVHRFADGSMVLTLLHPDYHAMRASGRHLYIAPDPRIAELEEDLALLRAGHQDLAQRLEALENRR